MKLNHIPTLKDIQKVHKAIKPYIIKTPVLTCSSLDAMTGAKLFFKCENFQKIGAFKMRGGVNATLSLSEEDRKRGVATHSSGNHAQAVALSAKIFGTKAYIVMPSNSPSIKLEATAGYGAEVILCEPTLEARESNLERIVKETGATFIHPYNNYDVIAGQATAAKELIEEVPDLDIMTAPIGGGGLMSGTALSTYYLLPNCEIIGTEPELANDAYLSFISGTMQLNTNTQTIADGLRTNLGEFTFEIIKQRLKSIVTVSESEIIEAMKLIWERMKIIVEPSSAVPLAAVLKQKELFAGKKVGIILTGGNVDLKKLPF